MSASKGHACSAVPLNTVWRFKIFFDLDYWIDCTPHLVPQPYWHALYVGCEDVTYPSNFKQLIWLPSSWQDIKITKHKPQRGMNMTISFLYLSFIYSKSYWLFDLFYYFFCFLFIFFLNSVFFCLWNANPIHPRYWSQQPMPRSFLYYITATR